MRTLRRRLVVTETDRKVSDQLVRLVQIIFGFVLAQSFSRYADVVLRPFEQLHRLSFFALVAVYVTAVLSWIDWHITMALRPYNFNPETGRRLVEKARLFSDLLIVSLYAYLLLAVTDLHDGTPDATLFLVGFVGVFAGYWLSGFLRRRSYGRIASSLVPITTFLLLYVALLVGYRVAISREWWGGPVAEWLAVGAALALMMIYRVVRSSIRARKRRRKDKGLIIGIDVDGVLANQIHGVLPRIKRRLGLEITYSDVTDWALPLGETDIAKEIRSAMDDSAYVLDMPIHAHAKRVLDALYKDHKIKVLTARPESSAEWTRVWIEKHALAYDTIASVKEKKKSLYATDLLVDDYIGNIEDFLISTNGVAVLVDQPWNRERSHLSQHLESGRLVVIASLNELPEVVKNAGGVLRPSAA